MNIQLLFQILLYQAMSEGIDVENAESFTINVKGGSLTVLVDGKNHAVAYKKQGERK